MIHHFFSAQFLRFLMVGGSAAFINWTTRYILGFWLSFVLSVIIAYSIGMLVAFMLNRYFVFPFSPQPLARQIRGFVLTNLAFYPIVSAVSVLARNGLIALGFPDYSEEIAHAFALGVPMFITFFIYKFLVFKNDRHA